MLSFDSNDGVSNKQVIKNMVTMPVPKLVSEIMTREIKTLGPNQSFAEVVPLLAGNHIHHIIVVVEGFLVGVLSDRDVYRQLASVSNWNTKKVGEVMITNALTIPPETRLSHAAALMLSRRVNCLPVVGEQGKLVGLITSSDIIGLYKSLQEQLEESEL
jgi:CBS domain-containing protein